MVQSARLGCEPVSYLVHGSVLVKETRGSEACDGDRVSALANADYSARAPVVADGNVGTTWRAGDTIAPGCRGDTSALKACRQRIALDWPDVPGRATWICADVSAGLGSQRP